MGACVWPQRRPGSLSTGAGGPMGVLCIRGSVGSRRRVLYVLVVVEVILGTYWWSESRCDGPRNILEVSLVVLVVIWAYSEGMSGLAMFSFLDVLFNLVTVLVIEGTY